MVFSAGPRMSTRRNFCATALLQSAGGKGPAMVFSDKGWIGLQLNGIFNGQTHDKPLRLWSMSVFNDPFFHFSVG